VALAAGKGGTGFGGQHEADLDFVDRDIGLAQRFEQKIVRDAAACARHDHLLAGKIGNAADGRTVRHDHPHAFWRILADGHDLEPASGRCGQHDRQIACRCGIDRAGIERFEQGRRARKACPAITVGHAIERTRRFQLGLQQVDLVAQHQRGVLAAPASGQPGCADAGQRPGQHAASIRTERKSGHNSAHHRG
jgi:hypothetical protein